MRTANVCDVVYKIMSRSEWEDFQLQGSFAGSPLDLRDGFVHLSAPHQVRVTASKHFSGQDGLMLLAFHEELLTITWETSRGGDLFPHVYGSLPMAALDRALPLPFLHDAQRHRFPELGRPVLRIGAHAAPYGQLSPESPPPVWIEGREWATAAHYFRSQPGVRGWQQPKPLERSLGAPRPPADSPPAGSDSVRGLQVLFTQVFALRFHQHPALASLLLATGDAHLELDAAADIREAWEIERGGLPELGKILMAQREALRPRDNW